LAVAQPALAAIINDYPQGTAPTADPNVDAFTSFVPSPNQENSGVVRIDHRFNGRDSAYARYSIDDGFSTSALNALAQSITIQSRIQNLALEESHIFSPTLLNEAQLGFNRNTFIQNQQTGSPYNFSITNFTTLSKNYSKTQIPTSFSVNDTLTMTRGAHTIKAGVDIRYVMYNEANSVDGTASYTSEANLLANKLDSILITAPLPDKGLRKTQYAGYLQDQWKLSRTFTLNLGMRYNYFAPLHEQHNNEDPFDIASCGGYCGMGTTFYFPNTKDFDPRVSFAYSPDLFHGNTVFRAGFGIYHGEIQLGDEDSPVVNTEPSTLFTASATTSGRIMVFDLDTLKSVCEIANTSAHGAAVDAKSKHDFGSSKPVAMWDSKSLASMKTIDVQGGPDGIMADPFNGRVYVLSHSQPNATVLDAKDGSVIGTLDLGGAPEQAVSDGKGHIYIDIEDKASIAVVDAKTLQVTSHYDLAGKGGTCAGLAIDVKHNILFAACRNPQTMVILNASGGKILETLPIGSGTDGAVFNPKTMEAFSSQGDSFAVEQTLKTLPRAKTLTLDRKTNHIILITAEFTPPTPTAPGERAARGQMVPDTFSILVVGK
jgi:hypothetical protein